jgi:uncharacterized protein YhdP
MADYRAPVLEVDGKRSGDLQHALAYVQASPLGPVIGDQFMGLTGSGPAQYQVQLTLPVISADVLAEMPAPPPPRDYTVRAMLDGVTVALPALRAPAQRVKGRARVVYWSFAPRLGRAAGSGRWGFGDTRWERILMPVR